METQPQTIIVITHKLTRLKKAKARVALSRCHQKAAKNKPSKLKNLMKATQECQK